MKTGSSKFITLIVIILLNGCATEYPRLNKVEPLPEEISCRIALLPFLYEGDVARGENIFYKAFASELKNIGGVELVQEGDLFKLYQQLKLYRKDLPNESQMQTIGNRLDAQLIILGEILEMTEVDSGEYVNTSMTVSVRIHKSSTGELLWNTYHKRKGEEYRNVMHYGRVNTITGLSRRMANEIITLWTEEGLNQCIGH